MEDSRLAAILTSPKNEKFVEGLIEDINSFGSDIIASLDKQNVVRLLQDLPKIGKGVQTYNKKLEEYLTDPAKIQGDIEAATQQVATQQAEKKAADLKSRLSAANSVYELRSIITEENMDSAVEGVLGELEAEGNQVAKNYRETAQYNRELNKALSETGEDEQVLQDAMSLWQEHFNAAENLEQLANPNSIFINNEEAFMEDSGGDVDVAGNRFQNARYALQRAM